MLDSRRSVRVAIVGVGNCARPLMQGLAHHRHGVEAVFTKPAIDMIRCAKLALDRNLGGPIESASAFFCKHPAHQMTDDAAYDALEGLIAEAADIERN